MKLYQHTNGIFYEKQADCPSRSFETVEFPFAASPKADFVAWLNQNAGIATAHTGQAQAAQATLLDIDGPLPVDQHAAKVAAQAPPAPLPHFSAQHPLTTMAVEDWIEKAAPSQLGTVIKTAALRLHDIARNMGDPA
jgi:hypothetical protein